jgi:two-component system, NarL family, response regulator DesR
VRGLAGSACAAAAAGADWIVAEATPSTPRLVSPPPRHTGGTPVVALAGLVPVYEFGLRQGLAAAGVDTVVVSRNSELVAFAGAGGGPLAVVLPVDHSDGVIAALAGRDLDVGVVVVVPDRAPDRYPEVLRAGATAAVPVDAPIEEVVDVVTAALRGRSLLPAAVARELAVVAGRGRAATPHLSAREVGWLRLLAESVTVAGLARSAGYSEREMYRLLSELYRRMGVTNRIEALLTAERWGLLDSGRAQRHRPVGER